MGPKPLPVGIVLAFSRLGFGRICLSVVVLLLSLIGFGGIGIGQHGREIGTDHSGVVLG